MSWVPPREFEEYRLVRPLGSGAMGQVYLAHDTLLDRAVAIKFIGAAQIDAATRERFFVEARAVARLSHPNVVGIHRVGEIRQRPYLVSEYVRGITLEAMPKPLPWERALTIGMQLARGLAAAHQRGVLHRDLKPANAIVADHGEAKLLDFGLAKLVVSIDEPAVARTSVRSTDSKLTADGALVGTPLYLAPELWQGHAATSRSDVYAFGILLYELLAGRAPHAGTPVDELGKRVTDEAIPSVATMVGDLPARFAAVVDACTARDPTGRPASGDEVCRALDASVPRERFVVAGNPYRGLARFESEHRAVFFGRDSETRAVCEKLRTEPLVVVAGDSGAGKSSLCRAAVIPSIADSMFAGRRWTIATMSPGPHPLAALEVALATRDGDGALLVVVDQLEELVTIADAAEAAVVAERLAELVAGHASTRVLASARSDFLGRLAGLPGLGEMIGRSLFLLGPLGDRDLREVIVGPLRAVGYEWESPAIVEELVESGRRNLPLLQFTLAELWDSRDDETKIIPSRALADLGGVAGALAKRADHVLAVLGDDREIAWRVLVRLMTAEGTRAVVSRRELCEAIGDREAAARVVERLVAARLLVVIATDGDDRIEVVHEALFTSWPRLVAWRRTHAEDTRLRDLYAEAARRWDERRRPAGLLWRGDSLAEYRAWRRRWSEAPTEIEAAFGAANDAEARRTTRLRLAVVTSIIVGLAIAATILYRSDRRAQADRDTAIAERAEAERQRRTLLVEQGAQELAGGHASRALVFLIEAMRAGDTSDALRVLVAEAMRPIEREQFRNHEFVDGVYDDDWAPDGSRFAVWGRGGVLRLYTRAGDRIATVRATEGEGFPAYTPDGTRVVVLAPHALQIFDAATGTLVREIAFVGVPSRSFHIDPTGGRVLVPTTVGVHHLDLATGALVRTFTLDGATAFVGARVSSDGTRVAACTQTTLAVWDARSGVLAWSVPREPQTYQQTCDIRFTPDGARVLASGHHVEIRDTATHALLAAIGDDAGFELSPDGTRAVVFGRGVAQLWNVNTGTLAVTLWGGMEIDRAQFSHDGQLLVARCSDRAFRVWTTTDGSLHSAFETPVTSPSSSALAISARFSPDGTQLLAATGNVVQMFRLDRRPIVDRFEPAVASQATSLRRSPDERSYALVKYQGGIEIFDRATHERRGAAALPGPTWTVDWSPRGTELVVAGARTAQIFDARLQPIRSLVGHAPDATINRAAYSPDGRLIATASSDRTARIFDAATGSLLHTLDHPAQVMSAAWSPDGRTLATACWDRAIRIWDATRGVAVFELRDPALKFLDVAFARDGETIAAASHSGVVQLWNLTTRTRTLSLIGHAGPTTTVAWSPDGKLLATSSSDHDVRVWDPATGRTLVTRHMFDEALDVSWNHAGTELISAAGLDGGWIWELVSDRRSLAQLVELVDRVAWRLVDGRLEVVDPMPSRADRL